MKNRVHLTIHVPGGFIDPLDYFWIDFRSEVGRISNRYEHVDPLRAVDAWRIAEEIWGAADKAVARSPAKRKRLIILAVNDTYWGGPDGMWEDLFDDADIEFSYAVKPMPGEEAADAA